MNENLPGGWLAVHSERCQRTWEHVARMKRMNENKQWLSWKLICSCCMYPAVISFGTIAALLHFIIRSDVGDMSATRYVWTWLHSIIITGWDWMCQYVVSGAMYCWMRVYLMANGCSCSLGLNRFDFNSSLLNLSLIFSSFPHALAVFWLILMDSQHHATLQVRLTNTDYEHQVQSCCDYFVRSITVYSANDC